MSPEDVSRGWHEVHPGAISNPEDALVVFVDELVQLEDAAKKMLREYMSLQGQCASKMAIVISAFSKTVAVHPRTALSYLPECALFQEVQLGLQWKYIAWPERPVQRPGRSASD